MTIKDRLWVKMLYRSVFGRKFVRCLAQFSTLGGDFSEIKYLL